MSKNILGQTFGTIDLNLDLVGDINATNLTASTSITGSYLTANKGLATDANKKIVSTTASSDEINFLTGTTSAIQTQLNNKLLGDGIAPAFRYAAEGGGPQNILSMTFQAPANDDITHTSSAKQIKDALDTKEPTVSLTANKALVSNGSGGLAVSDITNTELDFLDGVSSNIQTQLTTNASAITSANSAITSNTSSIATNASAITTANSAIATNASAITTANSAIAVNTTAIATNTSAITSANSAIATNATAIATNATAIAGKEPTVSLTANRALVSNGSGGLAVSDITNTELGYLDAASGNIQTQLNGKQPEIDSSNRLDVILCGIGNVDNESFVKLSGADLLSDTIKNILTSPSTKLIQAGSNLSYNNSTTPPTLNGTDTDTNHWNLASNVITNNNSSDVVVATTFKNNINSNANAHIGRGLFGYSGTGGFVGVQNIVLDVNGSNYAIRQNGNGRTKVNSSAGQKLGLAIGNDEKMTINSSGLVGIGTSDPRSALHVQGTMNANSLGVHIGQQGNSSAIEIVAGDTDSAFIDFTKVSADKRGRIIYSLANDSMSIETNNAERMKIDSGGNVGIGTTNPSSLFTTTINDSGSGDGRESQGGALMISNATPGATNTQTLVMGVNTTNAFAYIQSIKTNVSFKNLILNPRGGNVGIGTDDPDNTLTLDGVFQLNPQSGSAKFAMYSDNDKFEINKRSSSGGFQANMFVMNTSGFVGIGATSPSAKLDVNGSALTAAVSISNQSSLGMIGSRNFNSYSSNTYALLMNATSTYLNGYGLNGTPLRFRTNGVDRMYLSYDGKFGVGINNPAELLHVGGVCRATSFTTTSDDRVKHFEKPTTNCLTKIMSLKPTTYQKSNELYDIDFVLSEDKSNLKEGDELHLEVGFIAQEVKESIYEEFSSSVKGGDFMGYPVVNEEPDVIEQEEDPVENTEEPVVEEPVVEETVVEEEPVVEEPEKVLIEQEYTLNYNNIFVVAVGAIQELKLEIDTLKERIALLESKSIV